MGFREYSGKVHDDDAFGALLEQVADAPELPLDAGHRRALAPGDIVDGSFEIVSELGAGGMGVVYLARDLTLGREVALKVMRLDRWRRSSREKLAHIFESEARATARLNHPNIVTLHLFGNWEGLLYFVLERLRGETLAARLKRGPLPAGQALDILEQIGAALRHAHEAGIIHRDLKPQNVILCDGGRVKVLDFGLAALAELDLDERPAADSPAVGGSTISHAGTPAYMSPEQWRGDAQDQRADVWAAGVILHQLVTGELPFRAERLEDLREPPSLPAGPIGALLARTLAFDPAARLQDAAQLEAAIRKTRRALAGRRRLALGAGAAAAMLALAGVAYALHERGANRPPFDLSGTWAYAPEGRAGVKLSRLDPTTYHYEYTDAPAGAAPSRDYFLVRGDMRVTRRRGKWVLAGDVEDAPGWGKGQVGAMSFDVLRGDRLMMTRSDWGKSRDHYTFSYPPWLMVRVSP